jgi:cytochrome c553
LFNINSLLNLRKTRFPALHKLAVHSPFLANGKLSLRLAPSGSFRNFLSFKTSASPLGIQKGTAFAKFCGAIWQRALTFQSMKMLFLNNQASKSIKTIVLFVAVLTLSFGPAFAGDAKALYEKDCAKCHGSDGKGETKMGKKLGAKDYTDPKVQEALKDDAAFKATKDGLKDKEGKVIMKPAEGTSDEDIKALIAYMRAFKK